MPKNEVQHNIFIQNKMQHSQLRKQRFNKKTSSEACLKDILESAVIEWNILAKLAF